MRRLLMAMIAVQEPASSRFRTLTNQLTTHGDGGNSPIHSHNKLLSSLVRVTNGQYGKLSAVFVGSRWSCIRSCLELQLLMLPYQDHLVSSTKNMSISRTSDDKYNNRDTTEEGHRLLLLILDQVHDYHPVLNLNLDLMLNYPSLIPHLP